MHGCAHLQYTDDNPSTSDENSGELWSNIAVAFTQSSHTQFTMNNINQHADI